MLFYQLSLTLLPGALGVLFPGGEYSFLPQIGQGPVCLGASHFYSVSPSFLFCQTRLMMNNGLQMLLYREVRGETRLRLGAGWMKRKGLPEFP